jgi:DNA-binding transcriptional ArsR family regulator
MDHELLVALKALSDASRLRIVGLLAARPYAVEELSAALDLSPGTVVHHMKRLRAAGLVTSRPAHPYVEYSLQIAALQGLGRKLDETTSGGRACRGRTARSCPRTTRRCFERSSSAAV